MKNKSSKKLIDLKERATELRIKSILFNSVSASEAATAAALGMMHLNGEGVAQDRAKAARFLATAAKGGVAQAKHELALLHLQGAGVAYDPKYSIWLLQSASDDGYTASAIALAELYIFGKDCPRNADLALELLHAVVLKDEPAAMYYLAYIYDTEPERKDQFEAAYWYRRAAEHGHFKSQIRLASLYATGRGVPHCLETAEAFLGIALESIAEQDPRFLLWQGERLVAQRETEFLAHALIKAAAAMRHKPAQRLLLERGWRS